MTKTANKIKQKYYSAQILLITLLIMMILAIISISLLANTGRDVYQSVSAQQYESLYNNSEESILTVLDKYSNVLTSGTLVSLSDLAQTFPSNTCNGVPSNPNAYDCTLADSSKEAETALRIEDTTKFDNFELDKDNTLTINLAGYRGAIRVSWLETAAMDMGLIYRSGGANGTYSIIRDVYDKSGVLTSVGTHAFSYQTYKIPDTNSFRFTISTITGLAAVDVPAYLTITPRMGGTKGLVHISFDADAGLQPQMRKLLASSYLLGVANAPVPNVVSMIPIYPQPYSAFGYSLLVNGPVNKYSVVVDTYIDVPANVNGGISTGIAIQTGDIVSLTYVSGTWSYDTSDASATSGPNGIPGRVFCCGPYSADQPDGGAVVNTLVGKYLPTTWFKIGTGVSFNATGNGTLALSNNDIWGQYANNGGTIKVHVVIQR